MSYRRILPTGPTPCPYLAIGEAGGQWENEEGCAFVGKSGRLFNTYLAKNSIPRHRIRVTNIYPFWTGPGNPTPTARQIRKYRHILDKELRRTRPRFVLALGRTAAEFFLGPLTLEVSHGLPIFVDLPHGRTCVVPAYHPAAALHNVEVSGKVFSDIKQFSLIVRGLLRPLPVQDLCPDRDYKLVSKIGPAIAGAYPAVDTEGSSERPYCISYSSKTGSAEVVLAENITPIRLPAGTDKITFHHSLHDIPVLESMGITTAPEGFDDTMLMAKLLLIEPAGLKDATRRHCGMAQREYSDVVTPHWNRAVLRYLRRASKKDWGKPEPQQVFDKKTGKTRLYRPHGVNQRIASILLDVSKGKAVKLEDRWKKISEPLKRPIVKKYGPLPDNHPSVCPLDEFIPYAAEDADGTRRLRPKLWPMIQALRLERAYETDLHAIPMFVEMERNGMAVDLDHFAKIRPGLVKAKDSIGATWMKRWYKGEYINLASGDQVAEYLFGRLRIPPVKLTKGGGRPSVDENVLELIKDRHESIPGLLTWKKLHTNLTFVDRIPKHARSCPDGTSRIFPHINTQGTVTGRPSTSDPNLLNIPIRPIKHLSDEWKDIGKKIRLGFVASPGHSLLSVDLSQVELRICAHLSRDKEMLRVFRTGQDPHDNTSRQLAIDRYTAKIVNFLILYGGTYIRLRSELLEAGIQISEEACRDIIRDWFRLYSGVKSWLETLLTKSRRRGFVRGMSGRIRYLPNLYLPEGNPLRSEAERHAGNHPIQEGNAYITKRAMRRMQAWIRENPEEGVRPLLQIYDEILFEIPKGKEDLAPIFRNLMVADAPMFRVPLKADVAVGERWGEL